jgi:drug/metabolite transporter (DMT)-like permease
MGSSFVSRKILLSEGFAALMLVGWRFVVAALATLPLIALDDRRFLAALFPPQTTLRDAALVILIGVLQTAAVMGLLFVAMRSISASTAAILLFTNPIGVAVLGRLFLGESLHVAAWRDLHAASSALPWRSASIAVHRRLRLRSSEK